jgi:anti-anti-sigma factor
MNTIISKANDTLITAFCELSELVRGQERGLVDEITPLVRQQSVVLDLGAVDRIDAAGIAALISIYGSARDTGHCFMVSNPTPHVREILTLVGLDRILLDHPAAVHLRAGTCLQLSAA